MLAKTIERVADYLELLVRSREAVGEFYLACATAWPDEGCFWKRLAEEETAEAVRIEMLRTRVQRTPHGVGLVRPYPPAVLQAFIKSVESNTRQVQEGGTTAETARVQARDLAQSLIVSQPLRGFSFDDPRFSRYGEVISRRIAAYVRFATGGNGMGTSSPSQAA